MSTTLCRTDRKLSPEQQEVVEHEHGPQLVVAGPGSGKSSTLVARVEHLIRKGAEPERLLVCTFTNRAANEFKDRLEGTLGSAAYRVWVGTLHSTGARILRLHGEKGGFDPRFTVFDTRDSKKLVKQAIKELDLDPELVSAELALPAITSYKERLITPAEARQELDDEDDLLEGEIVRVYERYQELLVEARGMDFGDLVMNTVLLLRKAPKVRDLLGLAEVLEDEFQDTDASQWEMVRRLLPPDQSFTGVGDPDQSIFSFRGSDPTLMLNFRDTFPTAKIRKLGQNYRSSRTIVFGASALIRNNTRRLDNHLWTENEPSFPIIILPALDDVGEIGRVVREIPVARGQLGVDYKDIAILYRTNYQSQLVEEQCLAAQIPYHVTGKRFFDRRAVRDVLLWLRVIHSPDDPFALEELINRPKRRLSEDSLLALQKERRRQGKSLWQLFEEIDQLPIEEKEKKRLFKVREAVEAAIGFPGNSYLPQLLTYLLDQHGIRKYHEEQDRKRQPENSAAGNLQRLEIMVGEHFPGPVSETLPEFLEYVALMSGEETDEEADAVQLMTCHAVKGLEFRVVFLIGCEEKLLPHRHAIMPGVEGQLAIEEERRLFYVGCTRAKELLYLTYAGARTTPGGKAFRTKPSRFLGEIPETLTLVRKH